jgi:bacteriocin-like protein
MRDQSNEVMRELSEEEMKQVSGGVAGGVQGGALGTHGQAVADGVRDSGKYPDGTGPGMGNGVTPTK